MLHVDHGDDMCRAVVVAIFAGGTRDISVDTRDVLVRVASGGLSS